MSTGLFEHQKQQLFRFLPYCINPVTLARVTHSQYPILIISTE